MCVICEQYRLSTPEQKNNLQIEYDEHISNKILAREKKMLIKKEQKMIPNSVFLYSIWKKYCKLHKVK